jgi:hypothetical protein
MEMKGTKQMKKGKEERRRHKGKELVLGFSMKAD